MTQPDPQGARARLLDAIWEFGQSTDSNAVRWLKDSDLMKSGLDAIEHEAIAADRAELAARVRELPFPDYSGRTDLPHPLVWPADARAAVLDLLECTTLTPQGQYRVVSNGYNRPPVTER